jgi:hypothetical protein
MRHERRFLDDEDEDINDFDPAYFPRKVYKDGRGPRVRLMLTDAAPPQRRQLYDASHHRPHFADLTDASLEDGLRKAAEARDAWIRGLQDAWKTPSGQMQQPPGPRTSGSNDDDDDDGDLSPRDRYIQNLQTAYRTPIGQAGPSGADAIEAQRRRWNAEIPAKDAALADRDIAYGEYLDYLQNAWKRPCGARR